MIHSTQKMCLYGTFTDRHGRNPDLENDISYMQSTPGDHSLHYVRASSPIPNDIINACTQNKYNLALILNTSPSSLALHTSLAHLLLLSPLPCPHILTPCSCVQIAHVYPHIASINTNTCAASVQPFPSSVVFAHIWVALSVNSSHLMLWLSMPNILLTDLVTFLFFLTLLESHITATLSPMLLFSFHHHASCTPHFIHPHAVHSYTFFSSFSFCHHHAVASCLSSIPWLCLMQAPNACCHILSLCWGSSVDLTQTCTYSSSSIKGCKCQPERSSFWTNC